ncbi:MAG: STAS domain-containing protein, partial [Mycobacteriaceae bacterium]
VLFATCVRMVEVSSLRALLRSTRSDAVIVALTFTVTVAVDLVTAVGVGIAAAVVLALRAVARSAHLEQVPLDTADHSREERDLLGEHIVAYRLDGPLFFAAAHQVLLELPTIADVRVVILRMSRVSALDATGAHVLGDAITALERRGITVMLSGITDTHHSVLTTLGVGAHLRREGLVFPDTPAAIRRAHEIVDPHRSVDVAPGSTPGSRLPTISHPVTPSHGAARVPTRNGDDEPGPAR